MKKILFGICMSLVLFVTPAFATEWIRVAESTSTAFYMVFDAEHVILHTKHNPKVWVMKDLLVDRKDYASSLSLKEYNCTEKKSRVLIVTQYSDHMGTGEIVWRSGRSVSESDWDYMIPGSVGYHVLSLVCEVDELYKKLNK